jgi:hypothetical protein
VLDVESLIGQGIAGNQAAFAVADGVSTVSFAAGTRILTPLDEVAVEDPRGGELVATIAGHMSRHVA